MVENTKIEWADHTFNPWVGCTKVSPACDNCYAEAWAKRSGHPELWQGTRRQTSLANWKLPRKWNLHAAKTKTRPRVFCASLADVFDNEVPQHWRTALFALIHDTPNLDWLLLTKRIGNAERMLAADVPEGIDITNRVWLGATIANQAEADRDIPKLLATPARIRFLSCEPLLGPIDLQYACFNGADSLHGLQSLHWVIAGSESGPKSKIRACDLEWVRSLRDQCAAAGVAFHWKQHVIEGKKISNPELDGKVWAEFPTTTNAC